MLTGKQYIIVGFALIVLASLAKAAVLAGSCSSTGNQCDLSINQLQVCNEHPNADFFTVSVSGPAASWLNVTPKTLALDGFECEILNVFTVANCYAEPGEYSASITVSNGLSATIECSILVEQGHIIDLEIIPESREITQCEQANYTIQVTNNSTVADQQTERIYLQVNGLPEDWYALEKNTVTVNKGESENVLLTVTPQCDAELGSYGFEVSYELENPNFGGSKTAEVVIVQGQGATIKMNESYATCKESDESFEITITNTGKLADDFKIELNAPPWVLIDTGLVSLAPGENSAIINMTLKANSDNAQEYSAELKLTSQNYEYSAIKEFTIDLQDCYNIEVDLPGFEQGEKICVEEMPIYTFNITNSGTKDVEAVVTINGIESDLQNAGMPLPAGTTTEVFAALNPENVLEKGTFERIENVAIEVLFDASGSMIDTAYGKRKIEIAKDSFESFIDSIADIDIALRAFGKSKGCADSELLVPMGVLDADVFKVAVGSLVPEGKTPVAEALTAAIADFPAGKDRYIVIISDGKETCGGNLEEAANLLKDANIAVYSIGFDIDFTGKEQLEMVSAATGGKYFDAGYEAELISVLSEISQELEINKSEDVVVSFSLNVKGTGFDITKNYSVTVQDCYNIVVDSPIINLCKCAENEETITIQNIGKRAQVFDVSFSPEWFLAADSVSVGAGETTELPVLVSTPCNALAEWAVLVLDNENMTVQANIPINYLSTIACFRVDLEIAQDLDVNVCDVTETEMQLTNNSTTTQIVTLSSDHNWFYMHPAEITLAAGETKTIYAIISPPYDLALSQVAVTITMDTDYGFHRDKLLEIKTYGQEFIIDVSKVLVQNVVLTESSDPANLKAEFEIVNNTGREINITNAEIAEAENAGVNLQKGILGWGETITGELNFSLPAGHEEDTAVLQIVIKTDLGSFSKEMVVDVSGVEIPPEDRDNLPTGFFSLVDVDNLGVALVGLLVVVVVGLIAYALYYERKLIKKAKKRKK